MTSALGGRCDLFPRAASSVLGCVGSCDSFWSIVVVVEGVTRTSWWTLLPESRFVVPRLLCSFVVDLVNKGCSVDLGDVDGFCGGGGDGSPVCARIGADRVDSAPLGLFVDEDGADALWEGSACKGEGADGLDSVRSLLR